MGAPDELLPDWLGVLPTDQFDSIITSVPLLLVCPLTVSLRNGIPKFTTRVLSLELASAQAHGF
jgi:hypothetical protein